MMVKFHFNATFFKSHDDLTAYCLQSIRRRNRKITAFGEDLSAKIRLGGIAAVPPTFGTVDCIKGFIGAAGITYIVKNEEFSFRAKKAGIPNASLLQVSFGFFSNVACIPAVRLPGDRIMHIAADDQCGNFSYGIEESSFGIQQQQHIGLVNLLETADGRTVKRNSFFEKLPI